MAKWREIDQDLLCCWENLTIEAHANKDGNETDNESTTLELNEEDLTEITDYGIPKRAHFSCEQNIISMYIILILALELLALSW